MKLVVIYLKPVKFNALNRKSEVKKWGKSAMSLVSFAKIRKRAPNPMLQAILESCELINYSFEKEAENIVIKPNLCYYWDWTTGQTTDPRFIAALIDLIRENISSKSNISIVESDASAMRCKYAFKMLGYEKLARDNHVRLVNLSEDSCNATKVTVGNSSFNIMVPETIQNADFKINVSKIKYTVDPIKLTCALKNIFGCNPYPKKFKYHPHLGEMIVALNKAMKFDLCLIDGNIVSGIEPRKIGLVMASKDPVAVDAAAAEIAGINPRGINYLHLAEREGVGQASYTPKGLPVSYFSALYPRKTIKRKLMLRAYTLVTRLGLGKRLGL